MLGNMVKGSKLVMEVRLVDTQWRVEGIGKQWETNVNRRVFTRLSKSSKAAGECNRTSNNWGGKWIKGFYERGKTVQQKGVRYKGRGVVSLPHEGLLRKNNQKKVMARKLHGHHEE